MQMSSLLLSEDPAGPPTLTPGILRNNRAIGIHRNTVFRSLLSALRMTFPTVCRLVGDASFEELATNYIRRFSPESAILYEYGQSFPEYLSLAVDEYDCLDDVAHFDLLIDQVGRERPSPKSLRIPMAPTGALLFDQSLRCACFEYAVDAIRDAVATSNTDFAAELTGRRPRHLGIWRSTAGVSVRLLGAPAFAFLQALLYGQSVEEAIQSAVQQSDANDALESIQRDVFASSFCQI